MTEGTKPTLDRITMFDGLRGLLAWWVVFGHIAYSFDDRLGQMLHNNSAVEVFIILSGFVITYLLDTRQERYVPFITRRWFRLFPVYVVVLVISAFTLHQQFAGAAGALFLNGSSYQDSRLTVYALSIMHFWSYFLSHLTLFHGAIPAQSLIEADSAIVPTAWSLSLEWQYYLLAPFLYWASKTSKNWGVLTAFVMAMVFLRLIPGYKPVCGFFPSMMFYFLCGIVSYYVWKDREDKTVRKYMPWFLGAFLLDQIIRGEIGTSVWVIVFASLVDIGPKFLTSAVQRFLNRPFIQYLGQQSYPLYLGHFTVHMLVLYALLPLQVSPCLWGAAMASLSLAGSFLFAALLHKYIEKPGIRLGARLSKKIATDSAG